MSTTRSSSTSYTINISGDIGVTGKAIVEALQKYEIRQMQKHRRRDDDGDGSAGVAAMVPSCPNQGGGGMFLDEPAP